MLVNNLVKIECDPKDKKCIHDYTNMGYTIKEANEIKYFLVNLKDAPPTSRVGMLTVKCDYCGKEYSTSVYNYNRTHAEVDKDSCGAVSCNNSKRKETNTVKYGMAKIPRVMKAVKITVDNVEVDGFKCNVCGEIHPLTDFPPDSRSTIGISPRCNKCAYNSDFAVHRREYQADYQKDYAEKKKEERRKYRQDWWAKKQLEKKGQ